MNGRVLGDVWAIFGNLINGDHYDRMLWEFIGYSAEDILNRVNEAICAIDQIDKMDRENLAKKPDKGEMNDGRKD